VAEPDTVYEEHSEYVMGLAEPLSIEEELGKGDDEYVKGVTEPLSVE